MPNQTVYINGSWVNESKALIPLNDAGFLFGDGLFETVRFQKGKLFRPEKHFLRLKDGLNSIHLKPSFDDNQFHSLLNSIIEKNTIESGLIRFMVTRGEITSTPWNHTGECCVYIIIRPLSPLPNYPVKVTFLQESDYPIIRFNPAIKSLNYVGNMLAKKTAEEQGAYEPVFINTNGIVTECAIRNIFFIKENTLLTPHTNLGVLPGVMRDTILEIAHKRQLDILETHIPVNNIHKMDEAFVSSTGIGLLPCVWDDWTSEHKITLQLMSQLQGLIDNIS